MKYRLVAGAGLAVAALAAAGCGSSSSSSSSAAPASTSTATSSVASKKVGAPGAKVSFVSPRTGSKVGASVTAKVHVVGFKIAPADVGKPAKQGEGHLHFKMDEGKYDFPKYSGANGQLAVKLGVQGKYSPSVTPMIVYKGLPKGKHKLEVYLANNDHSNTGVEARTSFTVR